MLSASASVRCPGGGASLANDRVTIGPRDRPTYHLKAPKPDGTTELVLSPLTLLERLARLADKRFSG